MLESYVVILVCTTEDVSESTQAICLITKAGSAMECKLGRQPSRFAGELLNSPEQQPTGLLENDGSECVFDCPKSASGEKLWAEMC